MAEELASACEATAASIQEALTWIGDPRNDVRVAQERHALERSLRSHAYQARRLARSVQRPMCVGVFGPSQSGKSHLVAVLARRRETLTALFDEPTRPEIDFISEINPDGEEGGTGLVTRFSVHNIRTPAGFPVALRLLTQTDLLKILANAYIFEADHLEERAPDPNDIDKHIAGFEAKASTDYADVLREEDVWDVEDYFQHQLRRTEAKKFNAYWERFASCAPRLGLRDRAELFSILWGRHQALTDLYRVLLEYLAQLNFAEEAFCPIEALVPADKGILNVETLAGLDRTDAEKLRVSSRDNKVVEMPRPMITALAAELRIALKDNPWPFFEHTDLLDFPGYRGRTQHNLAKYLSEAKASALKELFLRGKGEYLFQRYTAEQELTSMLLCLPPGNPDVTTLPAVIEEWIAVTHGRTPEERRGRPTLLFFLLTMFDQHLVEQAEDEATAPGSRFQARLEASLLKPFAKVADSWPLRWTPEEPFRNCYWIRSPYYKAEGIIQYEGRHEEQIHERKMARIDQLRTASIGVPQVQAHFHDPLRAFHEVMNLNDGGVAYVAENLAQVCKPGMKREQVRARLLDLRRRVARALAPHYIQADAEKRTADRIAVADQVINDFEECIARHAFGTFLRGLCLARGDLADALHEAVTNGGQSEDSDDEGRDKVPSPKSNRSSLLDMVKSGKPASGPSAGGVRRSRADQLVWAAMQLWTQTLHEASEDEGFSAAVGVPGETLKQIAIELIATSRRIGLEMSIRSALANTFHFGTAEQAAAKATLVAERLIGRFVTELEASVDLRPPPVFDAKGIGDKAANFQQEFAIAWLRAFYAHVIANAQSVDGQVHDPEQNQRLGRILRQFEGTSNASAR